MHSCYDADSELLAASLPKEVRAILPNSVVFLRHGQTDWNRLGKVMGQCDIPLNREGIIQARESAQKLRNFEITRICTSPLKRCEETAQIVAKELGLQYQVIPELRERNWGVFESGPPENRRTAYDAPPGGETKEFFDKRVALGLSYLDPLERTLLVSHSGVFRTILGKGPNQKVGHADPIVIRFSSPMQHAP